MIKRAVALGLLFAAATCLFGGCIENDQSLTIVGVVKPDSGCTWSIDPDQWWARGVLDLQYWGETGPENPTYVLFPQIHNNMPFNGDPENYQANTMAVQLEKVTVTYSWLYGYEEVASSNPELGALEDFEETVYMAGTVDAAAEEGEPGKMVTGFEAIPHEVGGLLKGLGTVAENLVLGLEVVVHGTSVGGTEISSNQFVFPVYLCWGCLAVPDSGGYQCCSGQADAYSPFCLPGQDQIFLPCECQEVTD